MHFSFVLPIFVFGIISGELRDYGRLKNIVRIKALSHEMVYHDKANGRENKMWFMSQGID